MTTELLFSDLDETSQRKILEIKDNFLRPCRCESYHNYQCSRCKRLARQGAGDVLLGEVITKQMLVQLGVLEG